MKQTSAEPATHTTVSGVSGDVVSESVVSCVVVVLASVAVPRTHTRATGSQTKPAAQPASVSHANTALVAPPHPAAANNPMVVMTMAAGTHRAATRVSVLSSEP